LAPQRNALKGDTMAEPLEDALESDNKKVALLIAILALFLALAEAGAKNAEHRATELNIETSDLYNFYQAKKVRSTIAETAAESLEVERGAATDPQVQAAFDKQIASFKATVAKFEKDPKTPEDSLDAIQERAKQASEGRELSNRKLEHFEYASGSLQIAVVLASAAIITGAAALAWIAGGLGLIGAALLGLGHFAPALLPFFG
jgi:hypothetical protein